MIYPLNPALMELLVLAMICQKDSYGYQISQQMKAVSNLKDSTLYPVLRRLAENHCVTIYDQQFQGRNRKYYRITETGKQQKEFLEQEWKEHVKAILEILENSDPAKDQENLVSSDPVKDQENLVSSDPAKGQENPVNSDSVKEQENPVSSDVVQEQEIMGDSDAPEGGNNE